MATTSVKLITSPTKHKKNTLSARKLSVKIELDRQQPSEWSEYSWETSSVIEPPRSVAEGMFSEIVARQCNRRCVARRKYHGRTYVSGQELDSLVFVKVLCYEKGRKGQDKSKKETYNSDYETLRTTETETGPSARLLMCNSTYSSKAFL